MRSFETPNFYKAHPPPAQHRQSSWKLGFRPRNDLWRRQSGDRRWVGLRTVCKVSNTACVVAGPRSSSSVTTPLAFVLYSTFLDIYISQMDGENTSLSLRLCSRKAIGHAHTQWNPLSILGEYASKPPMFILCVWCRGMLNKYSWFSDWLIPRVQGPKLCRKCSLPLHKYYGITS